MLSQVPESIITEIERQVKCTGSEFNFISGGCINNGGALATSAGKFFLKWNSANKFPGMFSAEADGLMLLQSTRAVRIPNVICAGTADAFQFLLLEFISPATRGKNYWKKLGEQLATLHKHSATSFGLDHNNYIGSLPQINSKHSDWSAFFVNERLKPQVALALQDGKIPAETAAKFDRLFGKIETFLPEEKPSMLHGDLWSGNLIVDERGDPCLIDPAVYYGNREAEISFTQLFGGFENAFYESYNTNFPLEKGFRERVDLYNLYPLLVHVNLFGGGYIRQVVSILNHYV